MGQEFMYLNKNLKTSSGTELGGAGNLKVLPHQSQILVGLDSPVFWNVPTPFLVLVGQEIAVFSYCDLNELRSVSQRMAYQVQK